MKELVIDLPAPTPACSSNASGRSRHWRVKQQAMKAHKQACVSTLYYIYRNLIPVAPYKKAELVIEWHRGAGRGRDADGLYHPRDEENARSSLKACQDSLVAVGILLDDNMKVITRSEFSMQDTTAEKGKPRPPSFIRYRIRPIEE